MLLGARADPSLQDEGGSTPLHLAGLRGHLDVVDVLLDAGAPLEAVDQSGCSALLASARARNAYAVRRIAQWALPPDLHVMLLKNSAERKLQYISPLLGAQLHNEVADGSFERVKEVVITGVVDSRGVTLRADVNYLSIAGRNAVHVAVASMTNEHNAAKMIGMLIALGADMDKRDRMGESPLHVATKMGRAVVVEALLRFGAHPCLPNLEGHTPLMTAALSTGERRGLPAYDGALVNDPAEWRVVEDIARWKGQGDPPGPVARKAGGDNSHVIDELFNIDIWKGMKAKRVKGEDDEYDPDEDDKEEAEEEDEAAELNGKEGIKYLSFSEQVLARVSALAAVGFDDRYVLDASGRVNRGDRLQLYKTLFTGREKEQQRKMDVLWEHVTGPLLRIQLVNVVPPKASAMLQYLLMAVCGGRAAVFGKLVASGQEGSRVLPSWNAFSGVLSKHKDFQDRLVAVLDLCFRGPGPKLGLWRGSQWARDEYPREVEMIPWDALHYVDPDTAPIIAKDDVIPPLLDKEAFKKNNLPFFEKSREMTLRSSFAPLPHRLDQLQLANRLFVDEAMAVRKFSEKRVKLVGEKLLCPMLEELVSVVASGDEPELMAERRGLLRYLAAQMSPPPDVPLKADVRRPFFDDWTTARAKVLAMLEAEPLDEHLALLDMDRPPDAPRVPTGQGELLPEDDRRWLQRRHSTRAFIELRRCGAIESADDFNELIADLVSETAHTRVATAAFVVPPPTGHNVSLGARVVVIGMQKRIELNGVHGHVRAMYPETRSCEICTVDAKKLLMLKAENLQVVHDQGVAAMPKKKSAATSPAGPPQTFCERFWHAVFGLRIWAMAKRMQGPLKAALRRKLPSNVELKGPRLRPRGDATCGETLGWVALVDDESSAPSEQADADKPLPELPRGFTDMLRVEIVCKDEAALKVAFGCLVDSAALSPGGGRKSRAYSSRLSRLPTRMSAITFDEDGSSSATGEDSDASSSDSDGDEGPDDMDFASGWSTTMRVEHVVNGFQANRREEVFPKAAGVLLMAVVRMKQRGPRGGATPVLEQLVEIELMLKGTEDARWLANFMNLKPSESKSPTTRSPNGDRGPARKRPVHDLQAPR